MGMAKANINSAHLTAACTRRKFAEARNMIQAAAAAAKNMPKLKTMEIWNGRKGLAGVLRYQASEFGRPASLTWRGSWDLQLDRHAIHAWKAVESDCTNGELQVNKEQLDPSIPIASHGHAIGYLELSLLKLPKCNCTLFQAYIDTSSLPFEMCLDTEVSPGALLPSSYA